MNVAMDTLTEQAIEQWRELRACIESLRLTAQSCRVRPSHSAESPSDKTREARRLAAVAGSCLRRSSSTSASSTEPAEEARSHLR